MFSIKDTISLGDAALRLGPFLFSIIFLMVLMPYYQRGLQSVAEHLKDGNSAASWEVIKEYKNQALYCRIFGAIVLITSIAWWAYLDYNTWNFNNKETHVYQGRVMGVSPDDNLGDFGSDTRIILERHTLDSQVVYDFFILSSKPIESETDFFLNWVAGGVPGVPAVEAGGGHLGGSPIPIKFVPGEQVYFWSSDPKDGVSLKPKLKRPKGGEDATGKN